MSTGQKLGHAFVLTTHHKADRTYKTKLKEPTHQGHDFSLGGENFQSSTMEPYERGIQGTNTNALNVFSWRRGKGNEPPKERSSLR